jgi:hypothetical protein
MDVARAAQALAPRVAPFFLKWREFLPSKFCGSLLNRSSAIEAADLIKMETSTCGVSFKRRRWPEMRPV